MVNFLSKRNRWTAGLSTEDFSVIRFVIFCLNIKVLVCMSCLSARILLTTYPLFSSKATLLILMSVGPYVSLSVRQV